MSSFGVIYVATGERRHLEMASRSISSLRTAGFAGPVAVVTSLTDALEVLPAGCTLVQGGAGAGRDPGGASGPGEAFESRRLKTNLYSLSPFESSLYLDNDILALGSIDELWAHLRCCDVALCLDRHPTVGAALRWAGLERRGSPQEWQATATLDPQTPHYNSGVVLWTRSEPARRLFASWRHEWERFRLIDQLALARAVQAAGVNPYPLDRRFNYPSRWVRDRDDAVRRGIVLLHFWAPCEKQRMESFLSTPAAASAGHPVGPPEATESAERLQGLAEKALAHLNAGDLPGCESLCRRILQEAPEHGPTLHVWGLAAQRGGRVREAADILGQAARLMPFSATLHNNLGNVQNNLGQFAEAADSFRRALDLRPDYAIAFNNLGNALCGMGRVNEAVSMYRRALELIPRYETARRNLTKVIRRKASDV